MRCPVNNCRQKIERIQLRFFFKGVPNLRNFVRVEHLFALPILCRHLHRERREARPLETLRLILRVARACLVNASLEFSERHLHPRAQFVSFVL
jgi:hypothetical protein